MGGFLPTRGQGASLPRPGRRRTGAGAAAARATTLALALTGFARPAQATDTCANGGNYSYGCAPADYTVCRACFPNGAETISVCESQGDQTGDNVCAASGTNPILCIGCNEVTNSAVCNAAANCAWSTAGSACEYSRVSQATAPSQNAQGVSCSAGSTTPTGQTVAAPTQAPTQAPTPAPVSAPPTDGRTTTPTQVPTAAPAQAGPSLHFDASAGAQQSAGSWSRLQQNVAVPGGATGLDVTLARAVLQGSADTGNVAMWDNISVTLLCDPQQTSSACWQAGQQTNLVGHADGSVAGVSQTPWRTLPAGSSVAAFLVSPGGDEVFKLGDWNSSYPSSMTQSLTVPGGTTSVVVTAMLLNTVVNAGRTGFGVLRGSWLVARSPTTAPTPQVVSQWFSASVESRTAPVNRWNTVTVTSRVFSYASDVTIRLQRSSINGQPETGNEAYFTNITVVFACQPQTHCSASAAGVNRIVNGDASQAYQPGSPWSSSPVNFVVATVGADAAFVLSNNSARHPSVMVQSVPVPEGAYAVVVTASILNTVANTGITGFGYIHGTWEMPSPTAAPTTARPSPAPTRSPTFPPVTQSPNLVITPITSSPVPRPTGQAPISIIQFSRSPTPRPTGLAPVAQFTGAPTGAPTSAPTLDPKRCDNGYTPAISSIQPTLGPGGTSVTINGNFQTPTSTGGRTVEARCFWWFDDVPFVTYQRAGIQAGSTAPGEIRCDVPDAAPERGALVHVSVAVWVDGADTSANTACMSHYGLLRSGRFASFQYMPTLSPTPAPSLSPTAANGVGGAAVANGSFYNTSTVPRGSGSCTACVSCSGSSDPNCTAVTLSGVECPAGAGQPTPAPVGPRGRCACAELFGAAAMGGYSPAGLLPNFPETACGTIVSVACYQRDRSRVGEGHVTLQCLPDGRWNFSSWNSRSCTRHALSQLVNTTAVLGSNGVRTEAVQLGTAFNVAAVTNALRDILLLGELDVRRIGDWVTAFVAYRNDTNSSLECAAATSLATAVYKLMLASERVHRGDPAARNEGVMSVGVQVSGAVFDADTVASAVASAYTSFAAALAASDRNATSSSAAASLVWTAECRFAEDVATCPQDYATVRYHCEVKTSWPVSDNDAVRRGFWEPYTSFFSAAALASSIRRQLASAAAAAGGANPSVQAVVRRDVAVKTYQPTVQDFGPLLAAIAELALDPGQNVSVRSVDTGIYFRADSCFRLLSRAGSAGLIRFEFSNAVFAAPNCGHPVELDDLNVTSLRQEMAILRAVGYVNSSGDAGARPPPSPPPPQGPPGLPTLDSASFEPATLRRVYNCSTAPANLTRGQSLSVYTARDFLRLVNGSRRPEESPVGTVQLEGGALLPRRIGSRVVSLSLGGADTWPNSFQLDPPANITFTDVDVGGGTPTCAFYSFGDEAWRTDGVATRVENETTVVCTCSHLTNFAVLTGVDGSDQSPQNNSGDHATALAVIMYVGLAVSLACYVAVIVTYCTHRKLLTLGKVVLCHICATLSIGEAAFVAGIVVASKGGASGSLCTGLGVVAHYFLLAAFGWMLCEATFIHTNFTSVFRAFVRDERQSLRKYVATCYGIPGVVVAVTLSQLPGAYDNSDPDDGQHCFLSHKDGAIWAFVGPMLAIILLNVVMLYRVVSVVSRAGVRPKSRRPKDAFGGGPASAEDEKRHIARVQARRAVHASVSFFFLLGIGWVFGVFAVGDASLTFQYVFSVLLILQGVCLFYFHCYSDADARAAWRRARKRSSLGTSPGVVRGQRRSAPTGTEIFKKQSMVTAPSAAQHRASPVTFGTESGPTRRSDTVNGDDGPYIIVGDKRSDHSSGSQGSLGLGAARGSSQTNGSGASTQEAYVLYDGSYGSSSGARDSSGASHSFSNERPETRDSLPDDAPRAAQNGAYFM